MSRTVHKGDVGAVFTITIKDGGSVRNLSTITGVTIHSFNPATAVTTDWTGSLVGDGSTGQVTYTTTSSSDLPEAGEHYLTVTLTGSGGFSRTTSDRQRIIVVDHPGG